MDITEHWQADQTVVLRNKDIAKKNAKNTTAVVKRTDQTHCVKDVDPDHNPVQMVGHALRTAILRVRTDSMNKQRKCKGYTQDELAKLINVDVKELKLLEAGKLDHKKAKQYALKIECVFRINILNNLSSK